MRVGVLATRGPALAKAQWQPLMGWLNERVPERRFALVPLELDALAEAVAQSRLDFVITNPGQSVSLARQYPLAWLATLKSPATGDNLAIGAALVVPAQAPYRHWRDLEGQAVAAVSENAFGGYLAYRFEAGEQGVRLERFFSTVQFTGFPLDRLIERLAAEGHALLTSDPAISALGDCASFPFVFSGGARVRIESVQNAVDQARCISARLCGQAAPYAKVPWFWSEQGLCRLQMAGLAEPGDRSDIEGDPASGRFSVLRYRGDQLSAVESLNDPAAHMRARKALAPAPTLAPA